MKSTSVLYALVITALVGLSTWAPAAERLADPNDSYLRASTLYQDGMKAMEAGRSETAMGKLKSAQTLIQKITQSQPNWQPALVAYKLQKIENLLKELSAAHAQQQELVPGAPTVVASPYGPH